VVSVFIENPAPELSTARAKVAEAPMGHAQIGAASAFTVMVDGHRVTAVGEVPPETVKVIAQSLRPQRP
jgi:negative regulator of sigma E activity